MSNCLQVCLFVFRNTPCGLKVSLLSEELIHREEPALSLANLGGRWEEEIREAWGDLANTSADFRQPLNN